MNGRPGGGRGCSGGVSVKAPDPARTQGAGHSRRSSSWSTPTDPDQSPETYLGSERAQGAANGELTNGTHTFAFRGSLPADEFALSGTWQVGGEALTAREQATMQLDFQADDVYLDVGGTGTVTATFRGRTRTFHVSGAPDIYPVVTGSSPRSGVLKLTFTPGLGAYSFTFG